MLDLKFLALNALPTGLYGTDELGGDVKVEKEERERERK